MKSKEQIEQQVKDIEYYPKGDLAISIPCLKLKDSIADILNIAYDYEENTEIITMLRMWYVNIQAAEQHNNENERENEFEEIKNYLLGTALKRIRFS